MHDTNIEIELSLDSNFSDDSNLLYCGNYKGRSHSLKIIVKNIKPFDANKQRIKIRIDTNKSYACNENNFMFKISENEQDPNTDFLFNFGNGLVDIISEKPKNNVLYFDITSAIYEAIKLHKTSICFFISIADIRYDAYFSIAYRQKNAVKIIYTNANYTNSIGTRLAYNETNLLDDMQINFYGLSADKTAYNVKNITVRGFPAYKSGAILRAKLIKPLCPQKIVLIGSAQAKSLPLNAFRTFMLKASLIFSDNSASTFSAYFSDLSANEQITEYVYKNTEQKEIICATVSLCYDYNFGDAIFTNTALYVV